jgi:predicted metal-binding protein
MLEGQEDDAERANDKGAGAPGETLFLLFPKGLRLRDMRTMTKATSTTRVRAVDSEKIGQLERFAIEQGAYRARAFSARKVVIDERVRLKCQIPLCPHYGMSLTCPPNVPPLEEFVKAVKRYRTALLVQTRSALTGDIAACDREEVLAFVATRGASQKDKGGEKNGADKDLDAMKIAAMRLHKLVNEVEGKAMSLGFPYALGLIGGECMLCQECVGQGSGKSCRRPYEARPSMEGVGIDVIKTSAAAGLPFELPPKQEIVWSGLVLID